jgi:AcrR family transcriptional regulator
MTTTGRPRGRPASADRADVIAAVSQEYFAGRKIDVQAIARQLGLSRATVYRWFGSREALIGEALAAAGERVVARAHRQARGRGPRRLLDTFDRINRELAASDALKRYLELEREVALHTLTSSAANVQPRMVAAIQVVIEQEVQAGAYVAPADSETLAYAVVRIAEAFLYNDAIAGIRGDVERLLQMEALLLDIPPAPRESQ